MDPVSAHAASHNANEHNKLQHLETLKALGFVKEGDDEPEKTEAQQQYERGRKRYVESELDCARRSCGRALSVDSYKRVAENAGAQYDYHHGAMQGAVYSFEYGLMAASYIPGPTDFAAGVVDAAYGYHTGRYDALDVAQTVISSSSGVLRTARPFVSAARGADKLGRVAGHGAPSAAAAPSKMPVCMTQSHNPKADVFKRVARDDWGVSTRAKLFGTDHVHVFKGDRVKPVGTARPRNFEFAGDVFKFDKRYLSKRLKSVTDVAERRRIISETKELQSLYPQGVPFTGSGFPDFSRYAVQKVEIHVTGKNAIDFPAANQAAKLTRKPDGFTWHHHHDRKTMLLIPEDLHSKISHTGGSAIVRGGK